MIFGNDIEIVLTYGSLIDDLKIRGSTGTKSQAITGILKDINETYVCFADRHIEPIWLNDLWIVQMIDFELFSYMYMEKPYFVGNSFTEWWLI